jgi:HD-GYP domain-containing protein (c-di-GMP phosphodiesterase class II)
LIIKEGDNLDENKNKHVDKMISQNEESVVKRVEEDGHEYETTTHNIQLDIKTLIPGTSLSVPAYDEDGNLIKEANKEFTQNDIEELKKRNIKTIYYSLKSKKKLKQTVKKKFTEDEDVDADIHYIIGEEGLNKTKEKVEYIFEQTKKDERVDMSTAYNLVDNFYSSVKEKIKEGLLLLKDMDIEDYIYSSAVNVALMSALVCKEYIPDDKSIKNLILAAFLRDLGMIKLPEDLIKKPTSKFNKEEVEKYKRHPQIACDLISKRNKYIGVDEFILNAIKQQHEFYNGSGFPKGLSKDQINPIYHIITLADTFDYITRSPNFPKNFDYREALVYLYDMMGKLFEPRVCSIFIKTIYNKLGLEYLFGKDYLIILNTGEIALVEEENPHNILRPKLRIVADKTGKKYIKMFRVDLKADIDRDIVRIKKRNA